MGTGNVYDGGHLRDVRVFSARFGGGIRCPGAVLFCGSARRVCNLRLGGEMIDYMLFWAAKMFAEFVIVAGIGLAFAGFLLWATRGKK